MGNLIIVSAPSGSGKSTLVNYLLSQNLDLEFSISATSRLPREGEKEGVHYYFITADEFKKKIQNNEFLEYEEVYNGTFYGTLKLEVERIIEAGKNIIFDVDVVGGCNIKQYYGDRALSLFIKPPSIEELENRLINRGTDSMQVIEARIKKAKFELEFESKFDTVIVNDNLEEAKSNITDIIKNFVGK